MPTAKAKVSLLLPLFAAALPFLLLSPKGLLADPGVSGNYSLTETVKPKKSLRKIWSNLLAGYEQARNSAKAIVHQMRLTAALANSMEQNLMAWESVARRTEALLHADIWDENPILEVEKLEENLFQKTDALLYSRIPSAKAASENLERSRRQWITGLGWNADPEVPTSKKSLLASLGLVSLSNSQRVQQSREKTAFEVRQGVIAKTGARNDGLLFMADNTDAHLSAVSSSLRKMDASNQKEVSDLNSQLSENDFALSAIKTRADIGRLETYSQILLSKASEYNASGLSVAMGILALSALSDELKERNQK